MRISSSKSSSTKIKIKTPKSVGKSSGKKLGKLESSSKFKNRTLTKVKQGSVYKPSKSSGTTKSKSGSKSNNKGPAASKSKIGMQKNIQNKFSQGKTATLSKFATNVKAKTNTNTVAKGKVQQSKPQQGKIQQGKTQQKANASMAKGKPQQKVSISQKALKVSKSPAGQKFSKQAVSSIIKAKSGSGSLKATNVKVVRTKLASGGKGGSSKITKSKGGGGHGSGETVVPRILKQSKTPKWKKLIKYKQDKEDDEDGDEFIQSDGLLYKGGRRSILILPTKMIGKITACNMIYNRLILCESNDKWFTYVRSWAYNSKKTLESLVNNINDVQIKNTVKTFDTFIVAYLCKHIQKINDSNFIDKELLAIIDTDNYYKINNFLIDKYAGNWVNLSLKTNGFLILIDSLIQEKIEDIKSGYIDSIKSILNKSMSTIQSIDAENILLKWTQIHPLDIDEEFIYEIRNRIQEYKNNREESPNVDAMVFSNVFNKIDDLIEKKNINRWHELVVYVNKLFIYAIKEQKEHYDAIHINNNYYTSLQQISENKRKNLKDFANMFLLFFTKVSNIENAEAILNNNTILDFFYVIESFISYIYQVGIIQSVLDVEKDFTIKIDDILNTTILSMILWVFYNPSYKNYYFDMSRGFFNKFYTDIFNIFTKVFENALLDDSNYDEHKRYIEELLIEESSNYQKLLNILTYVNKLKIQNNDMFMYLLEALIIIYNPENIKIINALLLLVLHVIHKVNISKILNNDNFVINVFGHVFNVSLIKNSSNNIIRVIKQILNANSSKFSVHDEEDYQEALILDMPYIF